MDCLEGMKLIDDESIDLVVTDPPYNERYPYDIYIDYRNDYYEFIENCIIEIKRVLKKHGSLYMKHSSKSIDKILPILNKHLHFNGLIIWINSSQSQPKKTFLSYYEPIYFYYKDKDDVIFNRRAELRKKPPNYWSGKGAKFVGLMQNVWYDIKSQQGGCVKGQNKEEIDPKTKHKIHSNSMPVELPRRCILFSSMRGAVVLDPFMGSGSTAVAALLTGRNFIGFEISKNYIDFANRRLNNRRKRRSLEGFF